MSRKGKMACQFKNESPHRIQSRLSRRQFLHSAFFLLHSNPLSHNECQPMPAAAAGVYQLETQIPKLETIEPSQPPLPQRQLHPIAPNRSRIYMGTPAPVSSFCILPSSFPY
jgi:hypothetical protein